MKSQNRQRPGNQFYLELVGCIGKAEADKFIRFFGGNQIYIPRRSLLELDARNNKIVGAWIAGADEQVLATEYGITQTRIRQLLTQYLGPAAERDQKRKEMMVSPCL